MLEMGKEKDAVLNRVKVLESLWLVLQPLRRQPYGFDEHPEDRECSGVIKL